MKKESITFKLAMDGIKLRKALDQGSARLENKEIKTKILYRRLRIYDSWLIEAKSGKQAQSKLDTLRRNYLDKHPRIELTRTYLFTAIDPGLYYGVLAEYDGIKTGFFKKLGYKLRAFIAAATGNFNSWIPVVKV